MSVAAERPAFRTVTLVSTLCSDPAVCENTDEPCGSVDSPFLGLALDLTPEQLDLFLAPLFFPRQRRRLPSPLTD